MIAVLHPMKEELGGEMLKTDKVISVKIRTGEAAIKAVKETLASYPIKKAVLIGIAGGLDDNHDLSIGEIVLCSPIRYIRSVECQPKPDNDLLAKAKLLGFRVGGSLTLSSFGCWPDAQERIESDLVVDMEDYWIGLELQRNGIPFLVVRIVSDLISEGLSPEETMEKIRERVPALGLSLRERFLLPFLNILSS
jgi:nucleoside phosphorylase